MSTFFEVLEQLRKNQPKAKYGIAFEKLMVNFLKTDPTLSSEFDEVHRWENWKYNGGRADTGIDIVARRREDSRWVAIQAKFYKPTTSIQKKNIDSFFEASGHSFETENGLEHFVHRFIISTTDKWSSNAEAALDGQQIPTSRIGMADIATSPINWDVVFPGSELQVHLTRRQTFEPREHQQTAIEEVIKGFETHDRGKLIMACGTGKTFTALRLAEKIADNNSGRARILFLVPSIALLSQTLREWTEQATVDLKSFAVCSDNKASRQAEDIATYDLEVPVSTTGADVAARFKQGKRAKGLNVVFSTYQSIQAVHEAQQHGMAEFDLIVCDEAHRTTGVTLAGHDASNFVKVHEPNYIRARRRLYMTATPRLFDDNVKGKAEAQSAEIVSMDDEAIYGPDFHRLGFGEAVNKGLLTDYRVLVMTVDEDVAAEAMARRTQEGINLTTASAMIGAWNGLAKRSGKLQGHKGGFEENAVPMKRTVAFAKDIKTSKLIAESYQSLVSGYQQTLREHAVTNDVSLHNVDLEVAVQHVDGGMNAMERGNKISWLEATLDDDETRILSNARCLSEGVDVPSLDAVIFFNPRNSMVDVVQSVGRVMRKADAKDYGYIILPVAVPPGTSPAEALNDNTRFRVVWQILNALRAHDDRFNAKVNSISLNDGKLDELPIEVEHIDDPKKQIEKLNGNDAKASADDSEITRQIALFSLEEWQEAMYTKLVDKVGTRTYWEDWADDVAIIADNQVTRINKILEHADRRLLSEFGEFVEGLRNNLNDSISQDDAISMLSQHLITAPVFNALFDHYDFVEHNPVAQVMDRMVKALESHNLDAETHALDKFYESVRVRASEVTSASGKQQVIKELYERFFRKAFKKQAEALGIVYTPVEIVDFILRGANDVSKKHFGKGLTNEGVCILDPFAGTSTFMVRLLQSGLIKPKDLARKYANELFATEIMLLAYYVSAVNIETTYNALRAAEANRNSDPEPVYESFMGIALADTFQIHEDTDIPDLEIFTANNESIERQKAAPINVVIGNPPWVVGQTDASDFNSNTKYPTLDKRISETYVRKSNATSNRTAYDSYFRAFRWSTDRVEKKGIVGFVTNNGWIDGKSSDGFRKSISREFDFVYVFDLRGDSQDSRTAAVDGESLFDVQVGSAVFIGVKTGEDHRGHCEIFHYEFPDRMSKKAKLNALEASSIDTTPWSQLTENSYGDWKNHRSDDFVDAIPIGSKQNQDEQGFFRNYSAGFNSGKDMWLYNFSLSSLKKNSRDLTNLISILQEARLANPEIEVKDLILEHQSENSDFKRISWSRNLINAVNRNKDVSIDDSHYYRSLYRPFCMNFAYVDSIVGEMTYLLPSHFPTDKHENVGFSVTGPSSHHQFSLLASSRPTNYHTLDTAQFFPRFYWESYDPMTLSLSGCGRSEDSIEHSQYGVVGEIVDGFIRRDNISESIKKRFRDKIGEEISSDGIFHFVYGKLHDPVYRNQYATELKKMLPRINVPNSREEFDKFASAGEALIKLHIGYENVEPYPLDIQIKATADPLDRETWRVIQPKWAEKKHPETGNRVKDVTRIIYNTTVSIAGIPEEADKYMLGPRSALGWILDRYQVKKDKTSNIINDPNEWADGVGNPRYIVDLIEKVTTVAVETIKITKAL